jgi:competence protein ComFC
MVKKKERARGYNQSALIAEGIAKALGKPFKLLLREKENSMVQRDLNYTERFINVIDRYEIIENSRIIDKNILVVDDVFTTGATLNECSRSLITGGAEKVFTFALARSDLRRAENL